MTARTIANTAELDALPMGSIVRTARGSVAEARAGRPVEPRWLIAGYFGPQTLYSDTDLPALVLHDPSALVPVVSDAAVEALGEWDVDESDVAAIRGAALDGAAWALIDRTSDTADRGPSAETFRDALRDVSAAFPFLGAAPSASVECPGMFVGWSAFGATYPDTVCSTALTWEEGPEPASPTLCDADDDHRPKGVPCPVCDPAGFDRYEDHSGAHLAVYRLCGLVAGLGSPPPATREDVDLTAVLGRVWDDGNGAGLDGWTGPGRGAGEVDDEAVRIRDRAVRRALDAITPRANRG
ncbi:hypothetical protein [Sanguibacter sp. HDW7]|uniref:hypothetical protein n=1 Tax=Sanguibacter sp. HDW7 TaxID=2714931 RepID=UPI0014093502|nr:hypothetical protein [Sanguibacter sp. HDW7]QIK83092.1 hypothetical protein G7063_05220 [Sanguibacter sp. HDW7]